MDFIQRMIRYFAVVRRQLRRHRRLVVTAAAVVVFATTYALILPAITMDEQTATETPGVELAGSGTEATDATTEADATDEGQATEAEATSDDQQANEATSDVGATQATPAGSLQSRGPDYTVTVSYDETAGIPEGAQLQVSEIAADTDEYASYLQQAKDAMGDGSDVAAARFFDVSLLADGQKVEPATPVQIQISYDQALSADAADDVKQVHFADSGTEVLDVDATRDGDGNVTQVSLEQSSLSVTGTVVKALSEGWPDSEGYYVVVVKSGDKYYAVRSVTSGSTGDESYAAAGSLVEVTYDETTKKVTFPGMDDSSDLANYEWEYTTETTGGGPGGGGPGGRTSTAHYLGNDGNYIDPSESDGIYSSQVDLQRDGSGHLYYSGSYFGYSYTNYLSADTDNLRLDTTTSSSSAVQVFFANQFEATGTHGGTPTDPETPEVDLGAPATSKSLTSNDDGTYKLSLSVTGRSQAQQSRTKADVIIVFDRSGSMQNTDAGNGQRRDTVAINATKELARTLLQNNTTEYPDTVEIGIVQFNTTASTALSLSNNVTSVTNAIDGLTAVNNTGTNWEDALTDAANFTTRSDAKKYVIFVSDGNPTFYLTAQGSDTTNYYQSDGVYGGGNDSNATEVRRSYNAAKPKAKDIVDSGAEFYTVGVFGNVNRMTGLTAYAYSGNDVGTYPTGHYQTASDSASLTKAFQSIIDEINRNFAFTDVTLTDGITDLTSTAAISGTAGQFTYSGTDADSNEIPADQIPDWVKTATYDDTTKSVVWDLSNNQLPNGVTYKVEFTVWPTQQAYDVVAALQNGIITWQQEDATVNGQAVDWTKFERSGSEGSYTYSYRTNTSQTVTYKQVTTNSDGTTSTSDEKEAAIPADPLPAMPLDKTQVTVQKTFDGGTPDTTGLTLALNQDEASYVSPLGLTQGTGDDADTLSGFAFVAPGLIRTSSDGSSYTVLETGHDYVITESGTDAANWTLAADTYRPMVIGTSLVMLRKEGTTEPTSGTYYKIGDNYYSVVENAGSAITAKNAIKTQTVSIEKVDKDDARKGLTGAEFTLEEQTGTDSAGNPTWENVGFLKDAEGNVSGMLSFGDQFRVDIAKPLPVGTYRLTETKAPDGYVIGDPSTVVFQVTADGVEITDEDSLKVAYVTSGSTDKGTSYTITVKNTPGNPLPNSGGAGTTAFALAGAALSITALLGLALRRRSGRGDA